MKITEVNTHLLQLEALTIKIGSMPRFKVTALCVNVKSDEGHEGWSLVHWNLSNLGLKSLIDESLRKLLLKKDPFMAERLFWDVYETSNRICFGIPQATAALDVAVWDLVGHATGTPLYKLLGGMKKKVRAYASLPFGYSPKATAQTVGVAVDKGFTAVKIRIGKSLKSDEAVLREVRDHFPDLPLMADVNSGYSNTRDATKCAQVAAKYGLEWLEEPLQGESLEALSRVRRESPVDVAGGENDFGIYRFHDVLKAGAYDIIQPDVTRNGFTQMKRIETLAEVRGVRLIPHIFGLGHVYAANLSHVLSSKNCDWMEFPFIPEEFQLLQEPVGIDSKGFVNAIEKPGLGVEFDPAAFEKYLVK
ncbi:MAG: mandelate racemase/muconate lactonizing enzyme family protein [Promethearchaeota archaeon]